MVLCIGICHGRRKKVMSTATAQACQTWPLASCSSPSACACLLDDSAGSGSASKQAWLSLAKMMSRSIINSEMFENGLQLWTCNSFSQHVVHALTPGISISVLLTITRRAMMPVHASESELNQRRR